MLMAVRTIGMAGETLLAPLQERMIVQSGFVRRFGAKHSHPELRLAWRHLKGPPLHRRLKIRRLAKRRHAFRRTENFRRSLLQNPGDRRSRAPTVRNVRSQHPCPSFLKYHRQIKLLHSDILLSATKSRTAVCVIAARVAQAPIQVDPELEERS
jgi:hypothetical protein